MIQTPPVPTLRYRNPIQFPGVTAQGQQGAPKLQSPPLNSGDTAGPVQQSRVHLATQLCLLASRDTEQTEARIPLGAQEGLGSRFQLSSTCMTSCDLPGPRFTRLHSGHHILTTLD